MLRIFKIISQIIIGRSYSIFIFIFFLQNIKHRDGFTLSNTITKPVNNRTIQAFQAICLRMTVHAPWYVTNVSLHNELKIATIKQLSHTVHALTPKQNIAPTASSPNFIPTIIWGTQKDASNENGLEFYLSIEVHLNCPLIFWCF